MESPTTTVGRKKLCRIVKKQSELTEGQTAVGTEDFGALMMGETSKETEDPSGESSAHDDSDYHSAGHSDVSRNVSSSSEATSADGEISRTTAATPCWDEEKSEISAKFLQLLDFSLRLGYTEAQLRCVLAKLGSSVLSGDSCPSQDKILGELIKLGQEVECDRRVVGANEKVSDPQPSTNVCPYGRKCTYGRKCRFNHPERCGTPMRSVTERLFEHHKKLSPSNSAEPDRPAAAASKELLCRSASNPPGLPSRFLNIPSCSQQQQRKKIAVMTNCLYPAALINHFQLKQLDDRKLGGGEMNRSPLAVIHPGYLSEQYGDANSHAILTRHVSNPEEILAAMRNRNGQQADLPPQMDSYWPHTGDLNGPTRRQPTEDLQSCLDGSSVLRGPIESSRRQQSALLAPDGYLSRSDTHLNLLRTGCSEEAQRWISGDRKSPLEEESLSGNYYMPSTKVKFIPVGMALRRAPMPLNMVTRRTFCNGRQHDSSRKGLVLGVYVGKDKSPHSDKDLTSAASSFNKRVGGKLIEQLNCSQPLTQGKSRVLYNLDTDLSAVSVVAIGEKGKQVNEAEGWHEGLENVRRAVARGVLDLREVGVGVVQVDSCGHSEAAAEGATLSLFSYDELKSKAESKAKFVDVKLYDGSDSIACANGWERGVKLARGQNLARRLMEMPANLLYPMAFAEMAVETLKPFQNVSVHVRNEAWARENKMFSFLSVGQGSDKPSVFLEIHAKSADSAASKKDPIVFVGKGVCFDSGGISLKPGGSMDKMRGDMGGAACAFSALHTICRLHGQSGIHRNLTVLIPLVENMPSGKAIKPGDIVKAMNGKSIKIDNTDAEGRLILADALCYAAKFSPAYIIDLATLTGAIHTALGSAATGVFTNSSSLWENIYQNSVATGDRVWRMPLFKHYSNKIKSDYADLNNIAKSNSGGGSCTAAAFLKEFVDCPNWAHMDIAGVMEDDGEIPYLRKGMTGRPTRLLVKSFESLS